MPHAQSIHTDHVTISVGVATCQAQDGSLGDGAPQKLIGQADKALYAAKNGGRDCWRGFDPEA
jgi:PleD family two-component response regulator